MKTAHRFRFFLFMAILAALPPPGAPARTDDPMLLPYAARRRTPFARNLLTWTRLSLREALGAKPAPARRIPWIETRPGVFLTLMEDRSVRACLGTFAPPEASLSGALAALARRVVAEDTRRDPLVLSELSGLTLVISFVGRPRPCPDPFRINFRREGLKATIYGRERLLLPGESRTLAYGIRWILGIRFIRRARFERFFATAYDERNWEVNP